MSKSIRHKHYHIRIIKRAIKERREEFNKLHEYDMKAETARPVWPSVSLPATYRRLIPDIIISLFTLLITSLDSLSL
ncbi:hypothetical protein Pyrde_0318 [Pyrodictium delaneyi]|uniref:Uncharacterized protein n=1 Tax=Pyrodictium delaneyi TaxID=1273541 RepID=A0A0P0N252_9CREN|nr:hypothetical protein Pyrde_0318 [Pyrodictium delaneyi]